MKINMTFSCDNAAFGEDVNSDKFGIEVSRILYEAISKFEQGISRFPIRDSNGNTIGTAGIVTDDFLI